MASVSTRLEAVRRRIADAADCAGRDARDITIIGVTKTVGIDAIREAIAAGLTDFGENRVQEFLGKYGLFTGVDWHFIGTLQTNKVKDVVGRASLIHSVDSMHLLQAIDRRAQLAGVVQPVLLQVNVSGEESKHGFAPGDLRDVLSEASYLEHVAVKGLMTMAPLGPPEQARWVFRELRDLAESLREARFDGVELDELSMGMSNDFQVAIEEGATMVRLGRVLFGR